MAGEDLARGSPPCEARGSVLGVWGATGERTDDGAYLHTPAGAALVAARLRAGRRRS